MLEIIAILIFTIVSFVFVYLLSDEHLNKVEEKMIKEIVDERINNKEEGN